VGCKKQVSLRLRYARVAQRIEHLTTDQKVRGSNPFARTRVRPTPYAQIACCNKTLHNVLWQLISHIISHTQNIMFWCVLVLHCVELKIINIMLFNWDCFALNPRRALKHMKYMCSPVDRFCELLLTITKAAQELSISRSSMYRLISEGRIPTVNIVGKMRIKESSLKSYIDQLERESRLERISR